LLSYLIEALHLFPFLSQQTPRYCDDNDNDDLCFLAFAAFAAVAALVTAVERGFVCVHLFALDLCEKVLLQVGLEH
jgi:hypothetical protein